MALTLTQLVPAVFDSIGNRRQTVTDIALDNSYTAGGYVLTPQQLGLSNVAYGDVGIKTVVAAGPNGAFLDCSNPVAPKLKLNAAAAEIANNATLTGAIVEVTAIGYP